MSDLTPAVPALSDLAEDPDAIARQRKWPAPAKGRAICQREKRGINAPATDTSPD
jgi:hypothetical protein